jgi:replicative DNA helicase
MKKELLEKTIIGSILTSPDKIPKVLSIVFLDDFTIYRKHIEIIFKAWTEQKDIKIELVTNGINGSDVTDLILEAPTTFYLDATCKELKEINTATKLRKTLTKASKEVPEKELDTFVAHLQQEIIKDTNILSGEKTDIDSIIEEFTANQIEYEEKRKNGQELIGISCGFTKIDNLIDGLRKGHLWIIGGYTSMGKTFGGLNIVSHLIKSKKRVVFYSLEMSRVDVLARTLGIMSEESSRAISKGFVDKAKLKPVLKQIEYSNLTIITQRRTLAQILLSMHEETLRKPVDLFVIDYLGLVQVDGARSEYEQMKAVALEIQEAGKRFDTPILGLSQVSNDAAKSGDQQVMGFKGAGDIAAAADLAIELVSGEESTTELKVKMQKGEPVKIKWIIKKNRHGSVGYDMMEFNGKTGVFTELDENKF